MWYCWWKKSETTTCDLQNLVNNGINYLSTSAGFLPSTVWPRKMWCHGPSLWICESKTVRWELWIVDFRTLKVFLEEKAVKHLKRWIDAASQVVSGWEVKFVIQNFDSSKQPVATRINWITKGNASRMHQGMPKYVFGNLQPVAPQVSYKDRSW